MEGGGRKRKEPKGVMEGRAAPNQGPGGRRGPQTKNHMMALEAVKDKKTEP